MDYGKISECDYELLHDDIREITSEATRCMVKSMS